MHNIWKVYIPSNIQTDADCALLIGWNHHVDHNIIVASYVINPIELTNDDHDRHALLKKLDSINHANTDTSNGFECIVIGSTNIQDDCSDLMRIYETDVWLQLDQHFQLKQILTENTKDTNHYYIIQYHATDPFNIFSPYYTHNTGDMNASFASIIQLCNESSWIHSYLHPSQTQPEHNDCTSCLCELVCIYFEIIHVFYRLFYACIVYIPPLSMLPGSGRLERERQLSNCKFKKIISYLQTERTKACTDLYSNPSHDTDKKRKETLDVWCDIVQHGVNLILGTMFGYWLSLYLDQSVLQYLTFFDYNSIKCHIDYLMGIPIGLKLNVRLNEVFGTLSLLCLQILHVQIPCALMKLISDGEMDSDQMLSIWDVFGGSRHKTQCNHDADALSWISMIVLYVSSIKLYVAVVSSCCGITFVIALISDTVSFLSLPFGWLHRFFLSGYQMEAKMLAVCGKLFRGLKYNQLKHRVDVCVFDRDQLFIGVILFGIFTFLLPTLVVYFIYFSVTMIYIWTFQLVLDMIQVSVHSVSIAAVMLLCVNPQFICSGFDVCIESKSCLQIQLRPKSYGIFGYLRDTVNSRVIPKINHVPHTKFLQSLKLNMY